MLKVDEGSEVVRGKLVVADGPEQHQVPMIALAVSHDQELIVEVRLVLFRFANQGRKSTGSGTQQGYPEQIWRLGGDARRRRRDCAEEEQGNHGACARRFLAYQGFLLWHGSEGVFVRAAKYTTCNFRVRPG